MNRLSPEQRRLEAYVSEAQRLSRTGSFGWSVASDEHFWSAETFRIFELDPSSTVSLKAILERIHPLDMPAVQLAMEAANRAEGLDLEFRLLIPDGRTKYLHVVGQPEKDENGNVEVIGAVMDVTARKLTEIELGRSRAHLADAQRLSRTGFVGMEVSTKRIFWSEEAARIYGYPPLTEPTADLILQRCHPDDVNLVRAALEGAAHEQNDFDYEHRLLMPDGVIKHLHDLAHRVRDESGREEIVGAIVDVTDRKVAEEASRRQQDELRHVIDLTPQVMTVYGRNRERVYANSWALAYFGMTLDAWLHLPMGSDVHPEDAPRLKGPLDDAFSNGTAFELETRLRGADGTYRWFLARGNPVRDDSGAATRWYIAATDIEERKKAEDRLRQENLALREEVDKASMFGEIVGASAAMAAVLSRVAKVAGTDSTALITGETGTGKELIARAIHRSSRRSSGAFVAVNCAAIPRELIASELFGHEKGAFTGALQRRLGRFEVANGGSLFLDEVGELSPEMQSALLRVLQEREFERLGGSQRVRVDVRVIAATNRDLRASIAEGRFRTDLFYRLNVFPIDVPPLRQRTEDIPLLIRYLIERYARKAGKSIRRVNSKALRRLQSYPWPGNVRELQNVIERSVIVSESDEFTVDESWLGAAPMVDGPIKLSSMLAAQEKTIIQDALRATSGRVDGPSGAAARLAIPRSTLESRIRALKIDKSRFRT
jgi:PAS domain S-box-containing protein